MKNAKVSNIYQRPRFYFEAVELDQYLKCLSKMNIEKSMNVSTNLASKTVELIHSWNAEPGLQIQAIDCFIGDVYSGLQVSSFDGSDRNYADESLWILSGLYGFLRPLDGIYPYRLEMGYKMPDEPYNNLYKFWGDKIARELPDEGTIVNVSSVEYSKVITPYVEQSRIITPNFLTMHAKTHLPTFAAMHAKIARGAFAHWLIKTRITDPQRFHEFNELGYVYDESRSTASAPVFICEVFGGLGLSIRLS